jgi:hypothetical protein
MENMVAKIIQKMKKDGKTRFWSPMFGTTEVTEVTDTMIEIHAEYNHLNGITLNGDGKMDDGGETLIFPEKGVNWDETMLYDDGEIKPLGYYITDEIKVRVIKDAVDNLDFELIHRVMDLLNWTWWTPEGGAVPSVYELKKTVSSYLGDILSRKECDNYHIATGGFEYSFRVYEPNEGEADTFDNCVNVSVKFVLDDFDSLI